LKHGIATISTIPMRQAPGHRSEMVSQLLFGETYEILTTKNNWLQIKCILDGYEGWIDAAQHTAIAEKDFRTITIENIGVAIDLFCSATSTDKSVTLVTGSSLPFFDGISFKMGKEKFIYNGQAVMSDQIRTVNMLEKVALRYLNAPYLWGGRSPLGIDCSGFTQVLYKCIGTWLPRDAYQQAEVGKVVNFAEEAILGDLAFFNNEEGKITHVGMIMKDKKIIHASGRVRIDNFDHFGIFNAETNKYSHQLKIIKRML
jgi:cell wall-associated NlpC family hydrolase